MKAIAGVCVVATSLLATGCASTQNSADPFEGYNRAMFKFNDTVDDVALRPTAELYTKLPQFVQTGVNNFFGNLGDVSTALNNFLQGKFNNGFHDLVRVGVNSTIGIGGLIDVASAAGVQKNNEDFGQTLGKWGVGSGPYVVLPLLGPSTLRDTTALPVDGASDLWQYKEPVRWRNVGTGVRIVDRRANLLGATNLLEEAALDRYQFVRDAYLQRRENQVYDGDPPRRRLEEE